MSQLVVLKLGKGTWQQGFPVVIAQIWEKGKSAPTQLIGSLPSAPKLPKLYQAWQSLYTALHCHIDQSVVAATRGIEIEEAGLTHVSKAEFNHLCQQLKYQLNLWLNAHSFGKVERRLRSKLSPLAEFQVVIETEQSELRKFPWHLWNFFEDYPYAEVAISALEHEPKTICRSPTGQVRILAILGNSEKIDVQADRRLLEQLPGAKLTVLVRPQRSELNQLLWDQQGWDILFFAGHSRSHSGGTTGELAINETDSLTIAELKHGLKAAIANGLKFALFNSCDGLGLACAMADLNIPQLVVMRESVPDQVAQEFLKHWLIAFAGGKAFYPAVREAREKLQGLEDQFPSASWLPVICQNPAEVPPTWQELREGTPEQIVISAPKQRRRTLLLASVISLALITGIRQLGHLQPLELMAFDHLMQVRPSEGSDPNILLITITANDVQAQTDRRGSLSNGRLLQLLKKLDAYQPALIGLDVYRDLPIEPQYQELAQHWQQDDHLVGVCSTGETDADLGVSPPPDVPTIRLRERVGFADIASPDPDQRIRRYLLAQGAPVQSVCTTDLSFSLLLALRYLDFKGKSVEVKPTKTGLQIGDRLLRTLKPDSNGGYHHTDTGGYQTLLNYRAADPFFRQLTLAEAIDGNQLTLDLVRDRIVLIGTTDKNFKDYHLTPYSQGHDPDTPGVVLQAHMISQILGAVLEDRPLLWWLPEWGEAGWIWIWSLVGGVIIWRWRSPIIILLIAGGMLVVLYGCCYILLMVGGWLPFVPSALGLVATIGIYVRFQAKQYR